MARHISMATSPSSHICIIDNSFSVHCISGVFGAHKQQHECSKSPQAIKFARETFSPLLIHYFNEVTLHLLLENIPDSFTYMHVAFLLLPYVAMDKSFFSLLFPRSHDKKIHLSLSAYS